MTLQRIQALPLHLANQIAAGEVVERPASVLKELIENSLDAGATQIDVEILGAGSELIRITDNGAGIHKDDLTLALSRHATSKLHTSDDLSHIASLGFRGEALPSIASVSKLTLTSRSSDAEHAWQTSSDIEDVQPAAHPHGTSVNVADLFFNLPARRRFLRSNKTELHHLITTLHRLALSRFDVGFNFHSGDRHQLKLPAIKSPDNNKQRIAKICGHSFVNESLYIEQQFETIRLTGWIGNQHAHRPQTDIQHFFINGRVIRDRVINHAIRQAYGESVPSGRQAAFVLYLELPLDKVDVNVHPTKHEVRFRDARLIHGLITQAIQDALSGGEAVPSLPEQVTLPLPSGLTSVKELAANYHVQQQPTPKVKHLASSTHHHPPSGLESITLLHNRFALLKTDPPYLIDLALADQEQRQHQLQLAIEQKQLKSRPILVPMKFEIDSQSCEALTSQQGLLKTFAFEFSLSGASISIERIPYLLSQIDIKVLLTAVCGALTSAHANPSDSLAKTFIELIPLPSIVNTEQAHHIIKTVDFQDQGQQIYLRKLDPETLTSLFSG